MKRFKKVYIEIINFCNLSCRFCPKTRRKPQRLSAESFQYILKEIKPFTNHICLHVKGEPLLHPEILDFLDLAYEEGVQVNITTNGLLIHTVGDEFLKRPAIRQISFSLHSFAEHEKENYLDNILAFAEEANHKTRIIISLRLWNLHRSDTDSDAGNRLILEAIENKFSIQNKIEENIIPGQGFKIRERLYINTDYAFEWPDLNCDYRSEKGFCHALRDHIAVLADGTVVPCCLDGEGITSLGNIYQQNFDRIIHSKRAKRMVDGFTNHKVVEDLCMKCKYKERFEQTSRIACPEDRMMDYRRLLNSR
ncbi:MAG: radical SAM protein [Pseudomonadota bacterium]